MLRGLVPAPNTMLFASWFERSFATPSALPTALASRSAFLSYSLEKLVFHAVVTITESKCVIGEETKRTYMIRDRKVSNFTRLRLVKLQILLVQLILNCTSSHGITYTN